MVVLINFATFLLVLNVLGESKGSEHYKNVIGENNSSSAADSEKFLDMAQLLTNPKNVYNSYQGSVYCSPKYPIHYPRTANAVQEIVRKAISGRYTVKAFGSRHSVHDIICTDGLPMNLKYINYCVDNKDGTASFGGGILLIDALKCLDSYGKSLIQTPSYAGITLAGAMGTGAHGSSLLHPVTISDQLAQIKVVDGHGEFQIINEGSQYFNAARVHLGLLGIIVEITLKTVPLQKMQMQNSPHPESILFDGTAIKWAYEYDWFEFFWYPNLEKVIVSKGIYLNDNPPGNASTHLMPDMDPYIIGATSRAIEGLQLTRNQLGLRAFEEYSALALYQSVTGKPAIFSEDGVTLQNPAIGYRWRLQTNKCERCPWDNRELPSIEIDESAIAFDMSQFVPVFQMYKRILSKYPATFPSTGLEVRFSKPSAADMAITRDRYSFIVEWPLIERYDRYLSAKDGIGAYQAMAQESFLHYGGRPHWGKNGLYYTSRKMLNKVLTPIHRQNFINAMKMYDPNGVFLNKFGRRILNLSDDFDKDPMETRCALKDTCLCSSTFDCAPFQRCTYLNGLPVCEDLIHLNQVWNFNGLSNDINSLLNYTLTLLS